MSKFIKHGSCPECGSENNLGIYDDHEHCFGVDCDYHRNYEKENKKYMADKHEVRHAIDRKLTPVSSNSVAIKDRMIGHEAVQRYRVGVNTIPDSHVGHVYPYFDVNGAHVANKIRRKGEKAFYWEGDVSSATLFGQNEFEAGGRAITVVEGELDALAVYELTGNRYPCVSVKSASEAERNIADNFEYLNSFDDVVLAFDNDDPGQTAAIKCAQYFEPGKVRILRLRHGKDANDYLMKKIDAKVFIDEWYRASEYKPDGLKIGRDMWDEIENHKDPKSVPYPWDGMNIKTYGIRRSEMVIINAPTGVGKTSFVKEISYNLLMNEELIEEKAGVGFLMFEEPNYDTVIGLMSIHDSKPYHLPDTERTTEELRKAYEAVIDNDRVVIWDHFGSNNINDVLSKIRHMAALGCKYIVLDHLSIVVSDQSGDERKQLDEISTKIKTLCMEKDIAVIAVIHQNRQGEIRGTAGVEQLANIVIRLEREVRESNDWRRNILKVSVDKNRFCGRTGPACYLSYTEETGRLHELPYDQVVEYENGGNGAGQEMQF